MSNTESFDTIVEIALDQWTALRLAVDHCDRGSAYGRQMATRIAAEVGSLCAKGGDSNDIADLLEDLLDELLDTLCEDGSPEEVGALAVRLWEAYRLGGSIAARELLPIVAPKLPSQPLHASSQSSPSSSRSSSPIPTIHQPTNGSASSPEQPMELDEEGDGWTTVKRKHKH